MIGGGRLDPATWAGKRWPVAFYSLPNKDQVRGRGARGEARGLTPYGIDVAPNGHVFYTKLNGQRVGRIIPDKAEDDPERIVEWEPPVHGPRRLHVAPDGLVWVPGFASGNIASFDDPSALPPEYHIFTESRIPWFETSDALPRYPDAGPDGAGG